MPVTAIHRTEFGKYDCFAPISAADSGRSERKLGRSGPSWARIIVRAADPGHDRFDAEDRRARTDFTTDLHAGS